MYFQLHWFKLSTTNASNMLKTSVPEWGCEIPMDLNSPALPSVFRFKNKPLHSLKAYIVQCDIYRIFREIHLDINIFRHHSKSRNIGYGFKNRFFSQEMLSNVDGQQTITYSISMQFIVFALWFWQHCWVHYKKCADKSVMNINHHFQTPLDG